jgi:energy-coupling factor transport system ATP-binding protein
LEEVMFTPMVLGFPEDRTGPRARKLISGLGLSGLEERHPFSLSKGERQRLAVAAALAPDPNILGLDEPTKGLDRTNSLGLWKIVGEEFQGAALLLVTNDLSLAERCDSLALLKDGRLRTLGPPRDELGDADLLIDADLVPPVWSELKEIMEGQGHRLRAGSAKEFVRGAANILQEVEP